MPLLPVTFPDVQLLAVAYLRPLLAPVPVGVRVPNPRPGQFVTLRRAGGVRGQVLDMPRLDFFAWAQTDEAAHDLVQEVRRHVVAMRDSHSAVVKVDEFTGPIPEPDESAQPRWMASYEITLRGSSA